MHTNAMNCSTDLLSPHRLGLRREAQRHAAFPSRGAAPSSTHHEAKAVSPLRSATALQKLTLLARTVCVVAALLCAGAFSHAAPAGAIDPALVAQTLKTAPGPNYADSTRIFQGIPGIERAANGRLWALWYAGGPDEPGEGPGNYVVLVTSGDDGKTWSGPKLVIDPPGPVRAYDPCLSCATHALGDMPLLVTLEDAEGAVIATRVKQ